MQTWQQFQVCMRNRLRLHLYHLYLVLASAASVSTVQKEKGKKMMVIYLTPWLKGKDGKDPWLKLYRTLLIH